MAIENTEKEQADDLEKELEEDRPVFDDTPYNDEVVAIALDYLRLLKRHQVAVTN